MRDVAVARRLLLLLLALCALALAQTPSAPSAAPSARPTPPPTPRPTPQPSTAAPSTAQPTTLQPTTSQPTTLQPSRAPSAAPTVPTREPTTRPSEQPTSKPSSQPTQAPTALPTAPTPQPTIKAGEVAQAPEGVPQTVLLATAAGVAVLGLTAACIMSTPRGRRRDSRGVAPLALPYKGSPASESSPGQLPQEQARRPDLELGWSPTMQGTLRLPYGAPPLGAPSFGAPSLGAPSFANWEPERDAAIEMPGSGRFTTNLNRLFREQVQSQPGQPGEPAPGTRAPKALNSSTLSSSSASSAASDGSGGADGSRVKAVPLGAERSKGPPLSTSRPPRAKATASSSATAPTPTKAGKGKDRTAARAEKAMNKAFGSEKR